MKSPFEILDLRPFLFVSAADVPKLKQHHIKLSRQFHPDRFITASDAEKQSAEEKSSEINRAAREILDSWSRVEAVLKILGLPLKGKEAQVPEMALEFFQTQEAMEEDPKNSEHIRAKFLRKLELWEKDLESNLEIVAKAYPLSFESQVNPSWPPSTKDLESLLELYQRRNYIKRMIENLNPTQRPRIL